ncbi:MAG: cell division protein ZapA [Bacteroidales bacterium]|nr:cell division protein ZapA [Bacteroidales bacterium]MDD3860654.1 cell division protein ZapA [Bacteroidales bacterium]
MEDNKLIINISIGERMYPISIERGDTRREELIRKASQSINDTLLQYKKRGYKNKDDQDYLAMTVIMFAVKLLENESKEDISPIINELKKVNFELEEILTKE